MIIFDLSCNDNHRFEGWFRSADDFSSQLTGGLVVCPYCGSAEVRRLPSILHVGTGTAHSHDDKLAVPAPTEAAVNPLAALKGFVEQMVSNSEDVGTQFADEARKIHYHEAPSRSIRGQATEDDCSALQDEGIDILRLPVIKPEDLN